MVLFLVHLEEIELFTNHNPTLSLPFSPLVLIIFVDIGTRYSPYSVLVLHLGSLFFFFFYLVT